MDGKSIFTNEIMLTWMGYFSKEADLNLEKVKLLDISAKKKNVIPTVESNKRVLIFADKNNKNLLYDLWDAGLGDCDIWFKEGATPSGEVSKTKIKYSINIEIEGPCAMLIINNNAHSSMKIGIGNDNFSGGSIRYVGHELRAVMMSMLDLDSQDTVCIISGESIAVEAALAAHEGTIIAVEYDKTDRETMEENVGKFGLHNVEIVSDAMRETLKKYPVPGIGFIVASNKIEEEMAALLSVNPKCRFVIYTLDLVMLTEIVNLFKKFDIKNMEVVQIAVSKLKNNIYENQPVPWIITGEA